MNRKELLIGILELMRCPENGTSHDCCDPIGYTTIDELIELIEGDYEKVVK